jgi:FixJ family two-component response regulator
MARTLLCTCTARGAVDLMKGSTISIVDDDSLVREAIGDLVSSLGYQSLVFASAEEFLQSGQVEDTACLITDLQMPGLSGLDLQERLLDGGFRTPVIFITAHPKAKARERALNAGAVAFLSKPFEEISLISAVKSALNGS